MTTSNSTRARLIPRSPPQSPPDSHGHSVPARSPVMTPLDLDSDYGSDFDIQDLLSSDHGPAVDAQEELLLEAVLKRISAAAPIERTPASHEPPHDHGLDAAVSIDAGAAVLHGIRAVTAPAADAIAASDVYVDIAVRSFSNALSRNRLSKESSSAPTTHEQPLSPPDLDTRSPLERFRTKPKKPLSVTDLVSPAWCELQYSFVLTRFGRKPRTQAMKQGSKVHKVLEEQVHTFVPVQTASKEDRFGLRIWNVIQGLRTLRETGMTRELEIWGVLEGQLVCGVIDEVSYKCPDTRFEEELVKTAAEKTGEMASQSQRNIANYFAPVDTAAVPGTQATRPVYIADVKTRGVKSLPSGASLRPTKMQLMLYKKMLQSLAQNDVDADVVFARYSLNPLQPFTITEVAGMDSSQADETDFPSETPGFVADMETHTNLSALWSLMISEFAETFTGVSDVLRAEFRHSKDGDVIGSELFVYEKGTIEEYIAREMGWWKGERPAVGVEVEEAFKCRSCDFADECEWRKSKIQEATENHRRRVAGRGKVEVVG